MPLNPNLSNSEEEEKDPKVPKEAKEGIENWNGDIQRQKELKEIELKNKNVTIPLWSPKSQSTSTTDIEETVVQTPQPTDRLVPSGE